MFSITDNKWEIIKKKYSDYWNRENHDRPIMYIHAGIKHGHFMESPDNLEKRWLDTEDVVRRVKNNMQYASYAGEGYPYYMPNLGPDILGAILGCELILGAHTTWADHNVSDLSNLPVLRFNEKNKWWLKIEELTNAFAEDAKNGDYMVGLTDLHPGLDALAALRGSEALCYDLIDCPDEVHKRTNECYFVYKETLGRLFTILERYQKGSTHWMSIWHPNRWYNVSCDFMCVLSGEMFDDFVMPEIEKELAILDASMFHLDGEQAIRHLDKLLGMDKINGIQWVFGAGKPSASHWIPLLQRIQDAGKNIHIDVLPHEIKTLCENLRPEGLMFNISAASVDEANQMIKAAEDCY